MNNSFLVANIYVPARLDFLQSITGLFLALFMWLHMLFVSTILISKDALWIVARFFEGYYIFGRPYPVLVTLFVSMIFFIMMVHALLALRKVPANWQQYSRFWRHMQTLHHGDTTLWLVQVITGFLIFFFAPVHLYMMATQPELIGPYGSADRVWTGRMWPLYLLLLFAVELHGGIGLYRLAMKWGWLSGKDSERSRILMRRAKWILTVFFILLGLLSLAAYIKIGIEHASYAGERYLPSWLGEHL